MSHRHRRIIRRWVSFWRRNPDERPYIMPLGEYFAFLAANTPERWHEIKRFGHLRRYRAWRGHLRHRLNRPRNRPSLLVKVQP